MDEREVVVAGWSAPDPGGSRRIGMVLFLASLAILFGASIVAFVYLRLTSSALQGINALEIPLGLWGSTILLLGAGVSVHKAGQNARHGDFPQLRRWLGRTWILSLLFVAVQTPSMLELLAWHRALGVSGIAGVYGITFALVMVHALHVVGGMVPISVLAWKAYKDRLDSEHLLSVRACTAYWHFLEAVWILLLATFFFFG